jgi:hypothetical protein
MTVFEVFWWNVGNRRWKLFSVWCIKKTPKITFGVCIVLGAEFLKFQINSG